MAIANDQKPGSAEATIRSLAARHRVSSAMLTFDKVARTFAVLADAEADLDDVEQMLIHLARKRAITKAQLSELHGAYLRGE